MSEIIAKEAATFDPTFTRADVAIVMVDGAVAARWLERNTNNRTIRRSGVERYKNDIAAGRFHFAGDPVRFDVTGNLLDGQHRLTAIVESEEGTTVPLLVVRGLAPEAQRVMDQGIRRSAADQLGLRGVKGASFVAAAAKVYLIWQTGLLFRDNKVAVATITTPYIEEWVAENPDDAEFLRKVSTSAKQNDAPPSVAGAAAIAFGRIDPEKAVEFFHLLSHGAGTQGHPIVTLDKRLQRIRREGLRTTNRDFLSLFILAWNAWRDGRTMTKFQRPRGGSWSEETFPEPR